MMAQRNSFSLDVEGLHGLEEKEMSISQTSYSNFKRGGQNENWTLKRHTG